MNTKIIIAGIGGQGVLFAHQLIAEGAIAQNLNVTGAETHGMSQRGGSVVSHLKIGDTPAPLIRQGTADFLLAFDAGEAYRSLAFVRPGGTAIVNTNQSDFPVAQVRDHLLKQEVTLLIVDANGIAGSLGRASSANVVLVGLASACDGFPISQAALREALARLTTERFRDLNVQAFDRGVQSGIAPTSLTAQHLRGMAHGEAGPSSKTA